MKRFSKREFSNRYSNIIHYHKDISWSNNGVEGSNGEDFHFLYENDYSMYSTPCLNRMIQELNAGPRVGNYMKAPLSVISHYGAYQRPNQITCNIMFSDIISELRERKLQKLLK